MRIPLVATAILAALPVPGVAAAQQLSFSGGATLTSEYVASGKKQSDGPAFQPWIEGEINGFYFGAWLSNVDKTILGGDSVETDLYVGYRNEVGRFSYDLGYARYFYNNSGDCCGEVILNLGYGLTDALSMGLRVAHDPSAKVTNTSLSAGYAVSDKFSLEAKYGKINKGGHTYWSVGGSYAVSDSFGIGLTYHDTDVSKGLAVLSLDYSFSFR